MRIVLDANVLISAMLRPASIPGHAVDSIMLRHELIVTNAILVEWNDVVKRPKFDRVVSYTDRVAVLDKLVRISFLVVAETPITACRDPKDDKYLEAAVAGAAEVIVSGDADLLSLNPFRGIAILAPHDFLAAFGGASA